MEDIEQAALEVKLAEQEIARQVIEDKNRRIWELEKRIELLEGMLNRAAAYQPLPQPLPAYRASPRRWSVK